MDSVYGLIFDVDGVIADTERINAEASIRVFADLFGISGVTGGMRLPGKGGIACSLIIVGLRTHFPGLGSFQSLVE